MEGYSEKAFLGTGFGFPIEVDEVTGRFKMSSEEENIRQSIELILMTGKGERIMRPEFGCGLKEYIYETMDYTTLVSIEHEVKEALDKWEPRITDVKVQVTPDSARSNVILIHISYKARITNNPYNMVYPFYLQEGL